MKFGGLAVAGIVLAALTGLLYWSNHHKPTETVTASVDQPPKILTLNEADIVTIAIKKGSDKLALTKDSSGKWQITAPKQLRADQAAVSGLLSSLSSLNSERLVEERTNNLSTYGLNNPKLEVDVTEKNSKNHTLLIGDDTPTSGGQYAMLVGDPRIFTIASYTKNSVDKNTNDLRDKRLLTLDPDKISRVELITKRKGIEFGRNKDEWQIVKPKPLRANGNEIDQLVRKLTDAKMEFGTGADEERKAAAAFASGTPVATAKLTDESGTQELEIHKAKDDYYAKSSAVAGVYKVASTVGEGLDKGLDDFRNKKLFDFGYSSPDKIEVHDASKAYFLTHSGEDWWNGSGKREDANSVQSLLDKVRDLSATKFVDSGFTTSMIEITVTSNSGKRVERLAIAKTGDNYIARRENDSSFYQLDSKAVEDLQKAAGDLKPAEVSKPVLPK